MNSQITSAFYSPVNFKMLIAHNYGFNLTAYLTSCSLLQRCSLTHGAENIERLCRSTIMVEFWIYMIFTFSGYLPGFHLSCLCHYQVISNLIENLLWNTSGSGREIFILVQLVIITKSRTRASYGSACFKPSLVTCVESSVLPICLCHN